MVFSDEDKALIKKLYLKRLWIAEVVERIS